MFGGIVVDADPSDFKVKLEGKPAEKPIAERSSEIAFASKAVSWASDHNPTGSDSKRMKVQWQVTPPDGIGLGAGVLLSRGLSKLGRLTRNLPFNITGSPDPIERLPCDLGRCGFPGIAEVAPKMWPAGGLTELAAAVRARFIEIAETRADDRLKDAATALQVLPGMLPAPIR